MNFNNVELTEDVLLKTDLYFALVCQGCIDEVLSGDVKVNDEYEYILHNKKRRDNYLKGLCRGSFTYMQQAYFIQTGLCVPLLNPKTN